MTVHVLLEHPEHSVAIFVNDVLVIGPDGASGSGDCCRQVLDTQPSGHKGQDMLREGVGFVVALRQCRTESNNDVVGHS